MKKNKLLKTGEAADYLGVSRSSVTNWVRQDLLKSASTPGGHYLFSTDQLNSFAEERGIFIETTSSNHKDIRILAIDDDQPFREFISEALEVYTGYEFKEAEDGMQGALLIGTWMPDLVIVDLRMPNMNGVDFCRLLKKDPKTSDLKIIIASAYLSPIVKQEIKKLGVDAVLEKPVRLASLIATISKLLDLELS